MFVNTAIHQWASREPSRPAIALGDAVLMDYGNLSRRIRSLAGGMAAVGVTPGQRVGLVMENIPEYFEVLCACWELGAVPVPVNAKLHDRESAFILDNAQARWCFTSPGISVESDSQTLEVIESGSREYLKLISGHEYQGRSGDESSLAWLFYTSGTTGVPKGAMISEQNLAHMCFCYKHDVDVRPPWNSILHPAPLSHGSGLYALAHFLEGSCQVLPESRGFNPEEIFALSDRWPQSVFFAAPTMVRRLTACQADSDLSNLKSVIYGGATMLVADTRAYLDRFGPRICQLYGQGESPMTITAMSQDIFSQNSHPDWLARIGSAGTAQSEVEVKVVDTDGDGLSPGEVGEILCKSPCVVPGYWRNPDATADTIRDDWLWTGDLGSLSGDGYLTIMDRSKDLIISGGSNIYPREVEEVLLSHPDIQEVAVIGMPDQEWGEVVVAFYVPISGTEINIDSLDQQCLENIARFKRPKKYVKLAELPKNNYGKVLKTALRKLEV